MDGGITIQVPCKRHVAHYLRTRYGSKPRITNGTHEGLFLMNQLIKPRRDRDGKLGFYEETVDLVISLRDMNQFGHDLTPTAIIEFNKVIDDLLKELFLTHMDGLVKYANMKRAVAIRIFQEEHNFPEDVWKFETLKKYYDRHRPRKKLLSVA